MNDERRQIRGFEAGRWIILGLLILLAIGLYFKFALSTHPVAPPATPEAQ